MGNLMHASVISQKHPGFWLNPDLESESMIKVTKMKYDKP